MDPDPNPDPDVNDDPLQYGSEGLEVQKMQGYLNTLMPNTTPLATDGRFGTRTEARVIQFQMRNGLEASGIIDRNTWEMIIDML